MAVTVSKLRSAIRFSKQRMETYLKERHESIREFVGKHYSDEGARLAVPLPLLPMAVNIYARTIVARAPKVLVTTNDPMRRPQSADFQLAINQSIEKSGMTGILRAAAMQAMFGFALVKTGLEATSTIITDELTGEEQELPVGQPFTSLISPDDAIIDMSAHSWDEVEFIGHRFRVPIDVLKQDSSYDAEKLDKLDKSRNEGQGRASDMTTGSNLDDEESELLKRVDLWEIYTPADNMIYVLPADDHDFLLKEPEEWTGPNNPLGPYRFLGLIEAPDQILPVPPTAWWKDLHDLTNALWRKLGRQAERQKTIGVVYGEEGDAQNVKNSRDGEVVNVPGQSELKETRLGGPDQVNFAYALKNRGEFSYFSQSDTLGGMAPTSETLGQERLVNQSANRLADDMSEQVVQFARDVCHDHAYFTFYFDTREATLVKRLRGYDIGIPVQYDPWEDRGDFMDYQFDIEPYSMRGQTPTQHMETLMGTLQILMPMQQQLAAEGKMISASAIVDSIAKYTNSPDIPAIIQDVEPQPMMPGGEGGGQPAQTERTYTRKNVSEKTRGGQDDAMIADLVGGGRQPSEQAGAQA